MSRDRKADAQECKGKGNDALRAGDYDKAIGWYSEAIKLDGKNHVFYSNRSAAYLSKGSAMTALKDADECIRLKPDWPKGYARKGAALHKQKKYAKSIAAYEEGLKLDPANAALTSGLDAVKKEQAGPARPAWGGGGGMGGGGMGGGGMGGGMGGAGAGAGGPMGQLGAIFGADLFQRVENNPKLAPYLKDPQYKQMLTMCQQNPQFIQAFTKDPRFMETLSELLGVPVQVRSEEDQKAEREKREAQERARKEAAEQRAKERADKERADALAAMTPEERQYEADKEAAAAKKAEGNAAFKQKQWDAAIALYDEAIALDPKNMMYLNNKAAAVLSKGDFDGCMALCEEALKVGNAHRAPFDQVAKVYARMGNACLKTGRIDEAIEKYEKSLLENRVYGVEKKLKAAQKKKKEADALAYRDAAEGELAKGRGNAFFKEGKFPQAVKEYTDAIARDPENPVFFANRGAAYTKLMDFVKAKRDCEKALELNPRYVKAFSRKGAIEFFMKEYHKAMQTYEQGLAIEPDNQECKDGLQRTRTKIQSLARSGEVDKERARHGMADPEIQAILRDPTMQKVLQDMSGGDPKAAQAHMRDPAIMAKIEKLIAAGVVQTGPPRPGHK